MKRFREIFDSRSSLIYDKPGTIRKSLKPFITLLREVGVEKSLNEVESLYMHLANDGTSGIYSSKTAFIRKNWSIVYGLKTFLQDKDLIQAPVNSNDPFYHIPELEDKHLTFADLKILLGRYKDEGLAQYRIRHLKIYNTEVHPDFASRWLPVILAREVWEQITRRFLSNYCKIAQMIELC